MHRRGSGPRVRALAVVGPLAALVAACPSPSPRPASIDRAVPADAAVASEPTAAASVPAAEPVVAPGWKRLELVPWSMTIAVPERATVAFDARGEQLTIGLAFEQTVTVTRVHAPPPSSLAAAPPGWAQGDDLVVLEEATHPDGSLHRAVTFEVRVGDGGHGGRVVHRLETVSRVYVIVPLDDASYLECTAFVEFDLARSPDTLASTRDLCLSFRP